MAPLARGPREGDERVPLNCGRLPTMGYPFRPGTRSAPFRGMGTVRCMVSSRDPSPRVRYRANIAGSMETRKPVSCRSVIRFSDAERPPRLGGRGKVYKRGDAG